MPTIQDWYDLLSDGLKALKDHTKATRESTVAANGILAFRQELLAEQPPQPDTPGDETFADAKPEPAPPPKEVKKSGRPRVAATPAPEPEPEPESAEDGNCEEEEEEEEEEEGAASALPTNSDITEAVQQYYSNSKDAGGEKTFAKDTFAALRTEFKITTVKELPEDDTRIKFLAEIRKLPLKAVS